MKEERIYPFFTRPPDAARRARIEGWLAARHPSIAWGEIGRSLLGRPLRFMRIGQGRTNLLFVGAHHGMEWLTALLLYRFADDLCRDGRDMGNCSLFLVPMLNPDGVEIELHGAEAGGLFSERLVRQNGGSTDFSCWQANARGVDLNHNYDAGFAAYREVERAAGILGGGPTRYSGEYPASEPEVAALCGFMQLLPPSLILTLHTQGEEIFRTPADPPIEGVEELGYRLAHLSGYCLGQADGMAAYGGLSDYAAVRLRVPAFTVECGLGKNPLPIGRTPGIYRRLRRMLFYAIDLYR